MRVTVTVPARTREMYLPEFEAAVEIDAKKVLEQFAADVKATRHDARWALEIGTKLIALIGDPVAVRCDISDDNAAQVRRDVRERIKHLLAWLDEVPK